MGRLSTVEVLRLRATGAVLRDRSVRRFAQDDGFAGVLTKNIPIRLTLMGLRPGLSSAVPVRQAQGRLCGTRWGDRRSHADSSARSKCTHTGPALAAEAACFPLSNVIISRPRYIYDLFVTPYTSQTASF